MLEKYFCPGTDHNTGRLGLDLWRILVLVVLKQGLGCDYDRLHRAARDSAVRIFCGGDWCPLSDGCKIALGYDAVLD
ncbi:MAG: hypothetical protein OXE78_07735 [Gammaproteobacteria bacterium]|nr:hypothetical protein [Gammaproteobacteria bacterium]MCY4358784.1 hypothetical protein [Gammaproteobacteria bacterium]